MTDVEPLLREHFSAQAQRIAAGTDLLAGVRRARDGRRVRRRRATVVLAGVAVIAAAVTVPVEVRAHRHPAVQTLAAARERSVAPPAGSRAVAYAGIAMFVPENWGTNELGCGMPTADTVIIDPGPAPACLVANLPQNLSTLTMEASETSPVTTTTFAGLPAASSTTKTGGAHTRTITTVTVPSRGASYIVSSPDPSVVAAILSTAHQVASDGGCPTAVPPTPQPTAVGGPQILGTPTAITACAYRVGVLTEATHIPPTGVAELVAALDDLPGRYSATDLARIRGDRLDDSGACTLTPTLRLQIVGASPSVVLVSYPGCDGVPPEVLGATRTVVTGSAIELLQQLTDYPVASQPLALPRPCRTPGC